jgi:hypothetical protein
MDGTNESGRTDDLVIPMHCSKCDWTLFIVMVNTASLEPHWICASCSATFDQSNIQYGQIRGQDAGGFSAN